MYHDQVASMKRILSNIYQIGDVYSQYVYKDEWKGHTAGGCANFTTWPNNPQFAISNSTSDTQSIFIALSQYDGRVKFGKDDCLPIGLTVYEAKGTSQTRTSLMHAVQARAITPATRGARIARTDPFSNDRDS